MTGAQAVPDAATQPATQLGPHLAPRLAPGLAPRPADGTGGDQTPRERPRPAGDLDEPRAKGAV
ncbi:hypothetical protein Aros01_04343 [Streptosporangium roseum]|uniref:Uncharacterized protein n=1 Tax=Streptosporangium roseum (strain ATCC 12428 / DSM 43021 / JCM 3005 / KCTC 9067 / NCIMB 10171 / NRRL 2505 / NI 9100) TaxID=479432 RepID=D2B3R0_STRRD|nr:hypothetical protein Sros_6633 [Streptosporangium roseum DSM 43021]